MKRVLLLCLIGMANLMAHAAQSNPSQAIQPFSGTVWTTITQHRASGATRIVTQRSEVSRDARGQWKKAFYRVTNGPQYDVTAPLDHTDSGTTTSMPQSLAPSLSSGEILDEDQDLGIRFQSGLETRGRRRTFHSIGRQPVAKHILETWYSPALGMVVHSESHNFNDTVVVSDLTNLQLGPAAGPVASVTQATPIAGDPQTTRQASSELRLYRGLFSIVAHMERARLANPPSMVGDMVAVEDSLRTRINLSQGEWQSLVATAVKVDDYTEQIDKQARAFARQGREAASKSINPANAFSAVKVELHRMQVDQDSRVLEDITKLEADVGVDSTAKIHAYLHGPLAASAHVTQLKAHGKGAQ